MASLTAQVLTHALLGVGLAGITWAVGLGGLIGGTRARLRPADAVHAYPLGLLAVVAASLVFLVEPWLGVAAAIALLAVLLPLLRESGFAARLLGPALPPLAWALPAALGLPVALGLLLHGPTQELDSRAFGDMLYYVNKLVSASQTVFPFHDLLAEGQRIIYVEAAPSFVGAALTGLPGFDPILFHTTTLPAFMLASLCVGVGLLRYETPAAARTWVPVVALLALAVVPYPTWLTESPPMAMSAPLALSMYRFWSAPPPTRWLVALAAGLALIVLLTKVVAMIPLGIIVLTVLLARFGTRPSVVAGLAVGSGVVIALLFATARWYTGLFDAGFLPADAVRGLGEQVTNRDARALSPAWEIAGQILLLVALVRARSFTFAAALAVSISGVWFVHGQSFDMALATTVLLAALYFWRRPAALLEQRWLLLAAAVALTLSAWLREVYGIRAGLVLVTLLAVALVSAFEAATPAGTASRVALAYGIAAVGLLLALAGAPVVGLVAVIGLTTLSFSRLARRLTPALVPAAILLGLVGSASVAGAAASEDDLRLARTVTTLTTDDYRLWQEVEELVPPDGLVFTTMTGLQIDARHGWNNYPSIAGRQLYLAGWYDGRLTSRRDELRRRLALNAEVLRGELSPEELELDRSFASHYAVTRRPERVPEAFKLLYANDGFALYRVPS
jgi:hypothetical protein